MLQPTRLISTPFAQEGDKTEIQNVTGEFDNSATYRLGFPPLTMQSIRLGGKPPKGTDFNGVLFDITENISFLCKGGRYQYNAGLSTLIGGYPEGSNLLLDDNVTEVVSTVAGNQNNPNINMTGWILKPNKTTAVNVADASGKTQQQVNYNGGSKWHSRVGGYQENERVVLTNGDIVKSTINGNANNPNVNMSGWKPEQITITPQMFNAVGNGVADDSAALNSAIAFAIANNATLDGQGKTYACHSVLFDSNFKFKNAKLVCNKFDQDLISVLECSSYNDDPRWLENVYMENIHIDGKRELHTNIKDTTAQEDGGRSGFRFIRPVNGLTMIGCSGNNCASDGIILFPHGNRSSVNDTVKNVVIINSDFSGNRRHGGSSNSVNGMELSNVTCNNNGLEINPSAPINSGLRGDTVSGQLYGSGWDCEEYALDVQSTNMFFNDCTMTGNARSGLLVLTVGSPSGANKAVIGVNGGSYDIGVSASRDNWAILVTPVTNKNFPPTKLFTANNVNLNGGDIGGLGVDNFVINHPVNIGAARALEMTTMFATGNFIATVEAASSVVRKTFAPDVFRFNYANNLMQLNTSADAMELRGGIRDVAGGKFKLSAYRGIERGALEFRMNVDSGGTDLFYSTLGADKIAFSEFNLTPVTNGGYGLGRRYLTYSNVFSQKLTLSNLSVFATNAAAVAGGLLAGDVYRNSAGQLLIVF